MDRYNGSKLTLQIGDKIVTWEVPYQDICMTDLFEALQGLCVAQTFMPESFVRECRDFYEEYRVLYDDLKEKEDD